MTIVEIEEKVANLKVSAAFFMQKRRKDIDLYKLLASTLNICEQVQKEDLLDVMRTRIETQKHNGRNRVYAEKGADVALIVGRAVFEPEINRGTSWRYCSALREAMKRQLTSITLVDWLSENGGINTLFMQRGVLTESIERKTLHLNQPVQIVKSKEFTITLKMDHRGFFDVIC